MFGCRKCLGCLKFKRNAAPFLSLLEKLKGPNFLFVQHFVTIKWIYKAKVINGNKH